MRDKILMCVNRWKIMNGPIIFKFNDDDPQQLIHHGRAAHRERYRGSCTMSFRIVVVPISLPSPVLNSAMALAERMAPPPRHQL